MKTKNKQIVKTIFTLVFIAAFLFGEARCIYKSINCNWNPVGKAEVFYTIGSFTGAGGVIGYFNIEDR